MFGDLQEMDFGEYSDACVFNWTYLPVLDKSKDYAVDKGWDIMVAHPPCTCLAVSEVHWL